MNRFLLFFIFFSSIFIGACKKDDETFDPGYAYYPVNTGDYKIYQVYKKVYQPTVTTDETYEIKEVVAESFVINDELRYKLERYKRSNSSSPWPATPDSVWSVAVTNSKVVKVENNSRFVKLVFPVKNGQAWNGNIENSYGAETYTLKDVARPYTVLSFTFPTTAVVVHKSDSSLISKDYRVEVFAKDVGMVYRVNETYEYDQSKLGMNVIEAGITYYEKLTSYVKK